MPLLEAASRGYPLVTDDLNLFLAADSIKHGIAYNFRHLNPDNFGWMEGNACMDGFFCLPLSESSQRKSMRNCNTKCG